MQNKDWSNHVNIRKYFMKLRRTDLLRNKRLNKYVTLCVRTVLKIYIILGRI